MTFSERDIFALYIIIGVAFIALLFARFLWTSVISFPEGTTKMKEIALAIQQGSVAYLKRQFQTIALFMIVLMFGMSALPVPEGPNATFIRVGRGVAFILGALFSALTGCGGMWLAVNANVRCANAARLAGEKQDQDGALRDALKIAFRAGGVAGMFTVGLGLLGATIIVLLYQRDSASVLVGFGFGGALLAMFMRVGGGIYTKAADVGADLVGKVEKEIPEDDPRNAATIADNVGDNVGDCAGMAADLFESYEVTLVASLILGSKAFSGDPRGAIVGVMFPLYVRAIGVITSIVGIVCVFPLDGETNALKAINRGFFLSAVVSACAVFGASIGYLADWRPAAAVMVGLLLASAIQVLTQYFTDYEFAPVQEIAQSTRTGPATTILSGFSVGMESTVWAVLLVAGAIICSYMLGETDAMRTYYIALMGMGMLTTVGVVVSMDSYGPVTDNANGIAEMCRGSGSDTHFAKEADAVLTHLDAVGNTTKAITKGMAIATAVIAATSLFGSFKEALLDAGFNFEGVRVDRPETLVGLLVGGSVPFIFSALLIRAVGRAAMRVVYEVRAQFDRNPAIMEGKALPDYAAVVDICTKYSLRELITPGLIAVLSPIAVGFAFAPEALGAFLAGVILTGQLLAVMLSNAGGAWDNAKKLVESGEIPGLAKRTEEHKASIVGDTVGDPFKDTAGPALNPLIKVMNLVSLLIAPVVVTTMDNLAVRCTVTSLCVLILAATITWSKRVVESFEAVVGEEAPAGKGERSALTGEQHRNYSAV